MGSLEQSFVSVDRCREHHSIAFVASSLYRTLAALYLFRHVGAGSPKTQTMWKRATCPLANSKTQYFAGLLTYFQA